MCEKAGTVASAYIGEGAAADRDRCANDSNRCRSSAVRINATVGRPFRMLASLYRE